MSSTLRPASGHTAPASAAPPHEPAVLFVAVELAILASLAAFVAHLHTLMNHDGALYLQCAQLMLSGKVPYVDFVDVNPPLIMYLAVPIVLVARLFAIAPTLAFQLSVTSLVALSWVELRALLGRSAMALRPSHVATIAIAWLAASVLMARLDVFGQREHLFMLLYTPFLFLRHLRHEGRGVPAVLALLLGLQAGLGLFLKPDFLAIAVVAELALLAGFRGAGARLRGGAELVGAAVVGVAYAAHWMLVPAAMRDAFFGHWVPLILRCYDAYSVPTARLIDFLRHDPPTLLTTFGLLAAVVLVWTSRSPARRLAFAMAAIAATSLAFFLHERKTWGYHLSPHHMVGIVAMGLAWVALDARASSVTVWRRLRLGLVAPLAGGVGIVGLLAMLRLTGWSAGSPPGAPGLADAIQQLTQPGDRVLVLSTSVTPAYPTLVRFDRLPGSRHLWTFELPFMLYEATPASGVPPATARADAQRFLAELTEDVDRLEPRIVALNSFDKPQGCPPGFDLVRWFEQAGFIAHLAPHYAPRDGYPGLRVFVRSGS